MTDLRAAAQQALDALYDIDATGVPVGHIDLVIDTLKAALAQQQEEEPVEIKPPNPEGATQCIVRWFAETPAGWVGAWDREALERFTAHPPRREWRGLTEEGLAEIARQEQLLLVCDDLDALREIARAIEAALRSKNHE
jgi:hypothetical protein